MNSALRNGRHVGHKERSFMRAMAFVLFLLSRAVIANPQTATDTQELTQAAERAYEAKEYARCGDLYSRLGNGTTATYSAACCFALAGQTDRAFEMLHRTVDRGWVDTRTLTTDSDLASLRSDARWLAELARVEANWQKKFAGTNRELWLLREADQADREGKDALDDAVQQRDRERLSRVKAMISADVLKTGWDYFNAALILQHGTSPYDFKTAHELALEAATLDPSNRNAKILAATAQDRYLLRTGKPQIYGTQYRLVDGKWVLEPIDESAVTDDERAKWALPPLAELKQRVIDMNRKRSADQ